jgi:hypothetical protein
MWQWRTEKWRIFYNRVLGKPKAAILPIVTEGCDKSLAKQ